MVNQTSRTKQLIIRVTDKEYQALKARCSYPQLARWIREVCLGVSIPVSSFRRVSPELLSGLGRINGNLNQIAKFINTQNKLDKPISLVRLHIDLASIQSDLDQLVATYCAHGKSDDR